MHFAALGMRKNYHLQNSATKLDVDLPTDPSASMSDEESEGDVPFQQMFSVGKPNEPRVFWFNLIAIQ